MGHIKEPEGIDFTVDPTPLTTEDRKKISEIIAYYKAKDTKAVTLNSAMGEIKKFDTRRWAEITKQLK